MWVDRMAPVLRRGLYALLLALVVLAHVLCLGGQMPGAPEAPAAPQAAQASAERTDAEPESPIVPMHGEFVGEHHAGSGTAGPTADQRASAAELLLLLSLAALVCTAVPWLPQPMLPPQRQGAPPARRRSSAPLLLSLCIQRV